MKSYRTQPPGPYKFSKDERSILAEAKEEWSRSFDKHSGNVLRNATTRLVDKYKDDHGGEIEEGVEIRLQSAVKNWVLLNCKQAKRLDKKGTKSRNWRQVAYLLNKQEVLRRTDLLVEKHGGNRFAHHQRALSGFCSKLNSKKRKEYIVTARVWNKLGPPDDVKKQ